MKPSRNAGINRRGIPSSVSFDQPFTGNQLTFHSPRESFAPALKELTPGAASAAVVDKARTPCGPFVKLMQDSRVRKISFVPKTNVFLTLTDRGVENDHSVLTMWRGTRGGRRLSESVKAPEPLQAVFLDEPVEALAVSADGRRVAAGFKDKVTVFEITGRGSEARLDTVSTFQFRGLASKLRAVSEIEFSATGKHLTLMGPEGARAELPILGRSLQSDSARDLDPRVRHRQRVAA